MNALKERTDFQKILNLNVEQAAAYIGLGKNNTKKLCDEIGATIKIGRRVLFSKPVIDRYFEQLAADQNK